MCFTEWRTLVVRHYHLPWMLSVLIWFVLCILSETLVSAKPKDSTTSFTAWPELLPPHEVKVVSTTDYSITLSWKAPPSSSVHKAKLLAYSLVLMPLGDKGPGREKDIQLAPTVTTKTISGLDEGTQYVVILSAVYHGSRKSSAPKFTVTTHMPVSDVTALDDSFTNSEPVCNCSEPGTLACTRKLDAIECTCFPGYDGKWCELCASGNFRAGKECKPCPCTNITSSGECTMDQNNKIKCTSCLPGHRGSICSTCSAGYYRNNDRCIPISCVSFSFCAEQKDAPGCHDCDFLKTHLPPTAQRSNSERTIADGTIPLVAVIVTLGVLLLVAGFATCYRYWTHKRHQSRLPFWIVEPQDEKPDFHAHCQYQHLDANAPLKERGTPHCMDHVPRHTIPH